MPRQTRERGSIFDFMVQATHQEEVSFPMREAQIDMLRQLVESSNTPKQFSRGDVVHFFGCSGPFNENAKEMVFMFWRYLIADDEEDKHRITVCSGTELVTYPNIDCMLVAFTGDSVRFELCCSNLLVNGDRP